MNTEISKELRDYLTYPAVSGTGEVYFIKDNKIIAEGRVSVLSDTAKVYYYEETMSVFKDDPSVILFKDNGTPNYASFNFHPITGEYIQTYSDEKPDRLKGVTIVDKDKFDWGYHSDRYKSIEGYGKLRTITHNETDEKPILSTYVLISS